MRDPKTNKRTGIEIGDIISFHFGESYTRICIARGVITNYLIFEDNESDSVEFLSSKLDEKSSIDEYLKLISRHTGLQANFKGKEDHFVSYEMCKGNLLLG